MTKTDVLRISGYDEDYKGFAQSQRKENYKSGLVHAECGRQTGRTTLQAANIVSRLHWNENYTEVVCVAPTMQIADWLRIKINGMLEATKLPRRISLTAVSQPERLKGLNTFRTIIAPDHTLYE